MQKYYIIITGIRETEEEQWKRTLIGQAWVLAI